MADHAGSVEQQTLAEILALCPDPRVRDPARAISLARGLPPGLEARRITGIARCEAGEYAAAREELEQFRSECALPPADERVQLARVYLAMSLHGLAERSLATRALDEARHAIRDDPMAGWRTLNALRRAEEFLGR